MSVILPYVGPENLRKMATRPSLAGTSGIALRDLLMYRVMQVWVQGYQAVTLRLEYEKKLTDGRQEASLNNPVARLQSRYRPKSTIMYVILVRKR